MNPYTQIAELFPDNFPQARQAVLLAFDTLQTELIEHDLLCNKLEAEAGTEEGVRRDLALRDRILNCDSSPVANLVSVLSLSATELRAELSRVREHAAREAGHRERRRSEVADLRAQFESDTAGFVSSDAVENAAELFRTMLLRTAIEAFGLTGTRCQAEQTAFRAYARITFYAEALSALSHESYAEQFPFDTTDSS